MMTAWSSSLGSAPEEGMEEMTGEARDDAGTESHPSRVFENTSCSNTC